MFSHLPVPYINVKKGYAFTWCIDQSLIMPKILFLTKACVLLENRSLETD